MIRIDSEGQDISNGLLWISNCYQLLQSACYCNMDESEIIETVLSLVTSICSTVISKARAFQFSNRTWRTASLRWRGYVWMTMEESNGWFCCN